MNGIETTSLLPPPPGLKQVGLTGLYERDWNSVDNLSDASEGVGLTGLYERDWNAREFRSPTLSSCCWTDRTLWTGLKLTTQRVVKINLCWTDRTLWTGLKPKAGFSVWWIPCKLDWPDFMNGIETEGRFLSMMNPLQVGLTGLYERDWNDRSWAWSPAIASSWTDRTLWTGLKRNSISLSLQYLRSWTDRTLWTGLKHHNLTIQFQGLLGWTDRTLWTGLKPWRLLWQFLEGKLVGLTGLYERDWNVRPE